MKIDILVCFQHNFVMPCGVMIKSLLYNNQDSEICIHAIIDPDVTDLDIRNIQTVAEDYNNECVVKFYKIDDDIIDILPPSSNKRFDRSVYYRLFAPSILPDDIEKVLYLDCDIIVMGSLEPLWDLNFTNAIAAVMNQTQDVSTLNRLGLTAETDYYNSGVLLISLKYWRTFHVEEQMINYIGTHSSCILNPDQDTINVVLRGNIVKLPIKYNLQSGFLYKTDYLKIDYLRIKDELDEAIKKPVMIHYTGWDKPWMKKCYHPFKSNFIYFKNSTPWKSDEQIDYPFLYKIKKIIKQLLAVFSLSDFIDYGKLYRYENFRNRHFEH